MTSQMFRKYLFFVIIFVTVPTGCANISAPRKSVEPPFKWDDTYATPDTRLTIEEKNRMSTPRGTEILYQLKATGFSAQEPLSLWWKRGTRYSELPVTLNGEGHVQIMAGTDGLMVSGYVPGEALDLALASKTSDKRAHAKVIPFPIYAFGNGGCSASAEMRTESGLLFLISLKGFQPAEQIQTTSQYEDETKMIPAKASERGEIDIPLLFERGSRGKATLTAKGQNCTVLLNYNIGKDALVLQ